MLAGLWVLLMTGRRSTALNWIKASMSLPALFGGRHAQALPGKIGYVPNRGISSLIALYVVLNVIFSCVDFRDVQPNSWYTNSNQELAAYVGNRAGVLSFANMALAMLFSTRNNPLIYISGWTQNTFLALHRWAARVAIIQAVVHSIAYTADYVHYMETNMFPAEAKKPYFWWGIIATTAMSLMAGVSILPIRARSYELFLALHIALAILSLLGCWYHIALRFQTKWGYEVWLYLAFAFWAYDRAIRLGRLIYYSFLGGTAHGQVEPIPGVTNVVSLKLYPSRPWQAGPGQHTFVYFPSLGKVWENHPFTIASWGIDGLTRGNTVSEASSLAPDSSSEIKSDTKISMNTRALEISQKSVFLDEFYVRCLFRVHNGSTAKLYRKLSSMHSLPVLCEGSYGGHSPVNKAILRSAQTIIVVAGGIGITFAASYANAFAEQRKRSSGPTLMQSCERMVLAWSVREEGLLRYGQDELLPAPDSSTSDRLEYRFWLTGAPQKEEGEPSDYAHSTTVRGQRMDIADALGAVMDKQKKILVLVCGPGGLADDVRRQVVSCAKRGYDVELTEESFTW
jgi:predicted ferric reductase